MTRIATPANESSLLNIARYGTAGQLEQVVRNYRMCERLKLLNEAREAHALRKLSWLVDEDGYWVLKGRFTPEQAAMIRQALDRAMDALFEERRDEHPDVSAETRGGCCRSAQPRACRSPRGPCRPTAAGRSTTTTPKGCWSNTIRTWIRPLSARKRTLQGKKGSHGGPEKSGALDLTRFSGQFLA
jgi:hypothetical protein